MVGFGANRRGGRLPSFILIALLVVIGILSFNYWTVSSKHARLQEELIELQAQVTRTETARSRLEKRNSELMLQADNHKREVLKKEDEHTDLGNQLKAKDNQHKKCEEEKIRVQNNVSGRLAEIQQLQEQLAELRQEFLRQEDQIHEYKKNCTFLEKKLEYESLQCGQQISELKEQYEEKLKLVEQGFQDGKQKQNVQESLPNASHELPGGKAKAKRESVLETIERDMKVMEKNDAQNKDIKKGKDAEQVKLVRDAGMPGIEDNEIGKVEDVPVALKKPIITPRKNGEQVEQLHFITAKALIPPQENKSDHSFGKEHKPHPPLQDKSMLKPLNHQEVQALDSVDKTPIRFEEQQKRSQEGNPDEKPRRLANEPVIQIPANAMQNDPVQHLEKALEPGFEDLPQRHGAGAADLHQLKQNDEERELPGDNLGDYGKQHAANDVL